MLKKSIPVRCKGSDLMITKKLKVNSLVCYVKVEGKVLTGSETITNLSKKQLSLANYFLVSRQDRQ